MPYTSLKNLVGSAPSLSHKFLILVYGIKSIVKNSMLVTLFLHFGFTPLKIYCIKIRYCTVTYQNSTAFRWKIPINTDSNEEDENGAD